MPLGMYYQKALIATLTKKASPGAGAPIQSPLKLYISCHTANPTAVHTVALSNEVPVAVYGNNPRWEILCDANVGLSYDDGAWWSPLVDEDDNNEIVAVDLATQIGVHNNARMELGYGGNSGILITHLGVWKVGPRGTGTAADYLYYGKLPFIADITSENFFVQEANYPAYGAFRIGVK